MMLCAWCKKPLRFDLRRRQYVHWGGALYVQRCEECGHTTDEDPAPMLCPECGGRMVDDHCALPVARNAARGGSVGV